MRILPLVVMALCFGSPATVAAAQDNELTWHESYAAARAEAESTGKPLFVAFRCVP